MWHEVLTVVYLDEYKYSPHYAVALLTAAQFASSDFVDLSRSALCCINSKMYDSLGIMDNFPINQRIIKFQQFAIEFGKVTCKTGQGFNIFVSGVIGLTNQLSARNLSNALITLQPSAVETTMRYFPKPNDFQPVKCQLHILHSYRHQVHGQVKWRAGC